MLELQRYLIYNAYVHHYAIEDCDPDGGDKEYSHVMTFSLVGYLSPSQEFRGDNLMKVMDGPAAIHSSS